MSYAALFDNLNKTSRKDAPTKVRVKTLSVEQQTAYDAPIRESAVVIAGAGAGKTRLLAERVAKILKEGANPDRVAVVGFTKKSSEEIISRIRQVLGPKAKMPVCSTVHAMAYSVLKKEKVEMVLASDDDLEAIYRELKELVPPELAGLSRPEQMLEMHRAREMYDKSSTTGMLGLAFEESLEDRGLCDFTSLLSRAAVSTRDAFDYVIVDESQDLSLLQVLFLRQMGPSAAYWFIGDPDQAIYAFRGAHADMMAELRTRCDAAYTLTDNYRCGVSILEAANRVIRNNRRPFAVQWNPKSSVKGVVTLKEYANVSEERDDVIEWLSEPGRTRAVLARTQAQIAAYKELGLTAHTVHEAKGLEWDEVRVIGCEESLFPHPMSTPADERRLFYVAMTRAKFSLELSHVAVRSRKGTKRTSSRFIAEALGHSCVTSELKS